MAEPICPQCQADLAEIEMRVTGVCPTHGVVVNPAREYVFFFDAGLLTLSEHDLCNQYVKLRELAQHVASDAPCCEPYIRDMAANAFKAEGEA